MTNIRLFVPQEPENPVKQSPSSFSKNFKVKRAKAKVTKKIEKNSIAVLQKSLEAVNSSKYTPTSGVVSKQHPYLRPIVPNQEYLSTRRIPVIEQSSLEVSVPTFSKSNEHSLVLKRFLT